MPESRPEQYLREIRDLQQKNAELQEKNAQMLQTLVDQKQSELRWQHWGSAGRVLMIILPYALTASLSWWFYTAIQNSLSSFTSMPKSAIESITSGTKKILEGKETVVEDTSSIGQDLLDRAKQFFE